MGPCAECRLWTGGAVKAAGIYGRLFVAPSNSGTAPSEAAGFLAPETDVYFRSSLIGSVRHGIRTSLSHLSATGAQCDLRQRTGSV